jgi:hypothetical protein
LIAVTLAPRPWSQRAVSRMLIACPLSAGGP